MFDLSKLDARQRRIASEAFTRSDYPFADSPITTDLLAVNIYEKYLGRSVGGQWSPPRGPLEVALTTFRSVEYSVETIAHESGHAVSSIMVTDDQRAEIKELFGAPVEEPWIDPADPPLERLEEAFAEAFSFAYFDLIGKPQRHAWAITPDVIRGIRQILTPEHAPERPLSELESKPLVRLIVKYRDRDGNAITDTLVRATTRRRLELYLENDLPLRRALDKYKRQGAQVTTKEIA